MKNIKVFKDTMDIPYFTLTAEALTLQKGRCPKVDANTMYGFWL